MTEERAKRVVDLCDQIKTLKNQIEWWDVKNYKHRTHPIDLIDQSIFGEETKEIRKRHDKELQDFYQKWLVIKENELNNL